ncbi:MAG: decaprenyl-phosphate phosphoribosyltransferase [Pseudomonadota bacterium]
MSTKPFALLRLMRPHQWLKNGFVFVGLLFGHAWGDIDTLTAVLMAAAAFCLVSSAIYVINDLSDREADRLHPKKCHRPLAAGVVSPALAMVLGVFLAATGLLLAAQASLTVLYIVLGYAVMNLLYSWRLKQVVILDVFIIAAGFMLRILAGTVGVGIPPSSWLLLTGLMVTLFLGFVKRRSELAVLEEGEVAARKVLHNYSVPMLDLFIGVCAAGVVIAYSLYTMSDETVTIHQTTDLVYTVPFVLYGLFRYLYRTIGLGAGEDPASDLLRDPHLLLTVLGWGGLTIWLLA